MSRDTISDADLRRALRGDPPTGFVPIDVERVMREGRRRRRTRRLSAGFVVLAVLASAGLAWNLAGGLGTLSTGAPAGKDGRAQSVADDVSRHRALVIWAGCLRAADIPGVDVIGPAEGSDEVWYLDDQGRPLSAGSRKTNGEWGSAMESCVEQVPSLLPELETRWGNLSTERAQQDAHLATYNRCLNDRGLTMPAPPTAGASLEEQRQVADQMNAVTAAGEQVGCVWSAPDVWAEIVLQCPDGGKQSGWRRLTPAADEGEPKPLAAAQRWVTDQRDDAAFATPMLIRKSPETAGLEVANDVGRISAMLQLAKRQNGWTVIKVNMCG